MPNRPIHELPPDLLQWPFYWLMRVSDRYTQLLEIALKEVNLDVPCWRVLMQLDGTRRASVSDLAEHGITKLPTMTKIVQRMQQDGLVTCRSSPNDARVTEVMLTADGRQARELAYERVVRIYHSAFSGIETDVQRQMMGLMDRLFIQLGPPDLRRRQRLADDGKA